MPRTSPDRSDWLAEYAYLEWQAIQTEWTLWPQRDSVGIPRASEQIRLWRDESLHILGELTGIAKRVVEPQPAVVPGALVQPLTIECVDQYGCMVTLRAGYIHGWPLLRGPFRIPLQHFEALRTYPRPPDRPTRWLTEWYLNGPQGVVNFPRVTKRRVTRSMSRTRETSNHSTNDHPYSDSGYDNALVRYGDKAFILQKVPTVFGPSWSMNLGIEYRLEWGGIPPREEREAIAEIVGFVVGRRLLSVGYTEYDDSGHPISEFVQSPYSDRVRSLCEEHRPIILNLDEHMGGQNIETVLAALVPAFITKRQELSLSDAIWRFNMSRELPVGMDLPAIASALQGISKSVLKAKKVKRQYLDEAAYQTYIGDELAAIERKLRSSVSHEGAQTVLTNGPGAAPVEDMPGETDRQAKQDFAQDIDVIMNKLRGAWRATSDNESLRLFFREIKLPVSDFELKAIAARNSMDHGGKALPNDLDLAGRLTRTYHGLFQRVVLKLLGYNGKYIDLSTPRLTEQHIDSPQAGPQTVIPEQIDPAL